MQQVLSIQSMMLPFGSILCSLISGAVAKNFGWQWMCVLVGLVAFVNFICMLVKFPFDLPRNNESRIDMLGIGMLVLGLIMFIIGLL